jgi:hypothetical protein
MDKRTWTEADFEDLGWHDNHVHGFAIREGEYGAGRLILDLDYICEWRCGTDKRCTFMIAPADLVFRDVTDLRINIDYKNISLGPMSLGEIRREVTTRTEKYTGYRWQLLFNFPAGEISFEASGFGQSLRASPIPSPHQFLTEKERCTAGAP